LVNPHRKQQDSRVDGGETEGFLFAGIISDRRVTELRAYLAWEEHELLGAHSFGIDVDDQFQSDCFQFTQAEVSHLDVISLFWCEHNSRAVQVIVSTSLGIPQLLVVSMPISPSSISCSTTVLSDADK